MQHGRINLWLPLAIAMNDCKLPASFFPGIADQWVEVTIIILGASDKSEQIPGFIMECMNRMKHVNGYFLCMVASIPKFAFDQQNTRPRMGINLVILGHCMNSRHTLFLKREISWQNHDVLEGPMDNGNAARIWYAVAYHSDQSTEKKETVCCSLLQ